MKEFIDITEPPREKWQQHAYETRVGACADYLIGVPYMEIEDKWNVDISLVTHWIKKRGCFKTRRKIMR